MEKSKLLKIILANNGTLIYNIPDIIYAHNNIDIMCEFGHKFSKSYTKLQAGAWCPRCSKKSKFPIEELKIFAINKGGRCLSDIVENYFNKMKWQCKYGHIFEMSYPAVLNGHWCNVCSGCKKHTIEDAKQLATTRGGKCLSDTYFNNKIHLLWECAFWHIWGASFSNVRRGKWCPVCAGNKQLSLDDAQQLAKKFNGLCLSTEYVNSCTKLSWQCAKGHIFYATYNNVKTKNTWCSECSGWLSEKICRKVFEIIFKTKFHKVYPDWLLNDNGHRLQLDGFNEQMQIAFEHNGDQHYKLVSRFRNTEQDLLSLQRRDQIKVECCMARGIKLFVIPAIFSMTKLCNLLECIQIQAKYFGMDINTSNININDVLYSCYYD
jgi:hypothetical protein